MGCSMPASMRSSVVLPDAGGADDGEEFALPDIKIDAVDGGERAENLANRFERKDSRAYSHVV